VGWVESGLAGWRLEHRGPHGWLLHAFLRSFMRRTAAASAVLILVTSPCCLLQLLSVLVTSPCCLDLRPRFWQGTCSLLCMCLS